MKPFAILALFGCIACGPLNTDNSLAGAFRGLIPGGAASDTNQAIDSDPRQFLTRELIETTRNDLILIGLVTRDVAATAQPVGRNGDRVTWATLDGVSLTIQKGLIAASRGLGDDLMGADQSEAYAAVRSGSGTAVRIHDYIGSENEIIRRSFQCEYRSLGREEVEIYDRVYVTMKIEESCTGPEFGFTNLHWIDADGIIWQSRQWLSLSVGYVDLQRL